MNRQEVDAVIQSLGNKNDKQWLMIGVLASEKSVAGIPNKFPNRYPHPQKIKDIFPEDSSMLRLVHFSTQATDLELLEQMHYLRDIIGPNCDGFQLNIEWPSKEIVVAYKFLFPDDTLVLQCGAGAVKSVECNPQKLAERIAEYNGGVEYALIDPSGGYGKPMDVSFALETLRCLNKVDYDMNFGIAGGLNGDTIEMIRPIVEKFPDVSIDAEGGLRDADDHLDLVKVEKYVSGALKLFDK
jgi:hypothetical protein